MRVKVLYFGVLKDRFGAAEERVELPDAANVGELIRLLRGRTSNETMNPQSWQSIAVAVNREYASVEAGLREGDEVALLPPVSGGSFAEGEKRVPLAKIDYWESVEALPLVAGESVEKRARSQDAD